MGLVGELLGNGDKALSIPNWHMLGLVFVEQSLYRVINYSMCTCSLHTQDESGYNEEGHFEKPPFE